MNKTLKRWLALLLTLAALLPSAALAEESQPEAIPAEIETLIGELEAAGPLDVSVSLNETVEPADGDDPEAPEAPETPENPEDPENPENPETPEDPETPEAPGTPEPPETPTPTLAESALKLGVKEKYTLTFVDGYTAKDVGATFTSSKPKVASVDKSTGKVTGLKKGSAIIAMQTAGGAVCTCAVTVCNAPSKVTLNKSELTLGVGEAFALKAKLPDNTASALTFSSSSGKVATVDKAGRVVALKKGTATVTVKTFNGKKARCKVTVKEAPKSVALGSTSISLWLGDTYAVKPTLSKNSAGAYALSSDNEEAVAVSGTKIAAVGLGSATVTVTTYNGLTAGMTVEVRRKPVYRALLIGESTFPGTSFSALPASKDVSLMKNMLKSVMGAAGVKWSVVSKANRTSQQIHEDIIAAYSGAQEGDVSLFYISTHGNEDLSFAGDWPEYVGYLMTYPNYDCTNWYERYALTLGTLAEWLKAVPGQVIVVIDSCGSGAAVYGAKGNASAYSPERFGEAVVNAFEARDQGVMGPLRNDGAFVVENKFYVLTAAGYQEACYTKDGKYSYFTKWLTDGIDTKGRMPADTNKNKLTTLNELYKYIKKKGDSTPVSKSQAKQHVQVYPSGCGFELFYRK